ncbi:MAG TPA: PBP1A family penicillin-binding protein [Hydrogenophaga sp.]|uniref:penicillin-binding protein 1A n=1 Tax=Hydrogenophaga sp. TaxID=1904254 RepID=UPI002B57AAED|nr:PBP1A family penicillin-binding protein [Hydrogenophaga sp.]HMN93239.1 PBP1A family penicillin-binding protein [Hydrogenophaga sp.]HMP11473.1 PBP1A family penicillin-binding protein [Hydrogenophaga sp.]
MFLFTPRRRDLLAGLLVFGACLGATPGAAASPFELPPIDRIVQYQPKLPLQVFTADGVEIAQFGSERREYVPLERMPRLLQQAVLAVEDTRFHEHGGVDPKGMARAALSMLTGGRRQGASTITQQLVRTMLLTHEFSVERKAKEIVLALRVEDALPKERILEIYLNEIYLGQRAYGFAAASRIYFGKPLDGLSLAETAMLAGLPQNPHYANPVTNLERATRRQHIVLERMRATGLIDEAQVKKAKAEKLAIRPPGQRPVQAAHVAEMARRVVVERFGTEAYSSGIRVITSLQAAQQQAAHEALQRGVLAQDRRGPWRGPEARVALPAGDGPAVQEAVLDALKGQRDDEQLRLAVVLEANPKGVRAQLAGGESITLQGEGLRWARAALEPKARAGLKIERGSVIRVARQGQTWVISQWPEAEAALVALDPSTGRVRALVGSFDFTRQPFNHATQAWRQPGSAIKPLLYSAALESRIMPGTRVDDRPFTAANGWSPGNSGGQMQDAPISVREALARSSNLVSVRLLQESGTGRGREWLTRFGLEPQRQPDNLTLALGTGQVTPMQMARAYATLSNGGWLPEVVVVEKIIGAQGKVLFEAPPPAERTEDNRAIPARNAWLSTDLLAEVTRSGTAASVQQRLGRSDLYGKTGTTDKAFDAWFAGFHPSLAAVVWVGHGSPRSLGPQESGSRTALPIWTDFMGRALRGVPVAAPAAAPPGLGRSGDDWIYSEWQDGGWITEITDEKGVQLAGPPTLLDALKELFRP